MKSEEYYKLGTRCKKVNLKVTGWSIRNGAKSLKATLDSIGKVHEFLHYPEIQTTYASLVLNGAQFASAKIRAVFPGARIERVTNFEHKDTRLAELTVKFSPSTPMLETSIYDLLSSFGELRILSMSQNAQSNKWFCLATYYEKYSLTELLNKILTEPYLQPLNISPVQPTPTSTTTTSFLRPPITSSNMNVSSDKTRKPNKSAHTNHCTPTKSIGVSDWGIETKKTFCNAKSGRERGVSVSTAISVPVHIPHVFKQESLYFETMLKIAQSRTSENIIKHKPRSSSVQPNHSDSYNELGAEISPRQSLAKKRTELKRELLFLSIGDHSHRQKHHPPQTTETEVVSAHARQDSKKTAAPERDNYSALSRDSRSDGFTVTEVYCLGTNAERAKQALQHVPVFEESASFRALGGYPLTPPSPLPSRPPLLFRDPLEFTSFGMTVIRKDSSATTPCFIAHTNLLL